MERVPPENRGCFLLAEVGVSLGRDEVERLWRGRLEDAKLRLEFARNYVDEVREASLHSPEFDRAMRAENVAQAEYVWVLRAFTNLVLAGIIPDEDEWRKVAGAEWSKPSDMR